jgi:uncharacterized protein with PIN domain
METKTDAQGNLLIPMTLVVGAERLATSSARCSTCNALLETGRDLCTLVMMQPADYPAEFYRWHDLHLCSTCRAELLDVARAAEKRQEQVEVQP